MLCFKIVKIEYLDLSNFETSNVTDMGWMFNKCHKLKQIKGINNFNTNKVTNLRAMFQLCKELAYLDLSNFNTYNVIDMEAMFNECHQLKQIRGINKFNTNKVIIMRVMFHNCKELEYLDLSNFNTSNVTDMRGMFCNCYKIKVIIGINNFIISKFAKINLMFDECYELQNDLSKFGIRGVKKEDNRSLYAVNFMSTDSNIIYPVICKKTDNFSTLEEKLFEKYPELKRKNIYYLVNGSTVNRLITIEQNKIKNNANFIINENEL